MKAIYSGCIADPWLDVAQRLDNNNNIKPVYWIGWQDYDKNIDLEKEIKNKFNGCVFHELSIAWKAIFPEAVNTIKEVSLDGNLLDKIAAKEIIAYKMMDRLDANRKSFSFEDRQRHFRRLLSKWLGILDYYNITLFISASVPHRVFDYALYVACELRGVKRIILKLTPFKDLLVGITDIEHMPIKIRDDYNKIKKGNFDIKLPEIIINSINILKKDYNQAEPDYMKKQKEYNKVLIYKKILLKLNKNNLKYLNIFKQTKQYHKVPNKDMEKAFLTRYKSLILHYRGLKYKKNLREYYESLCEHQMDFDEKFVFVALHYQPEETTSPSAGHYVDQSLMIRNIAEMLPPDIMIYVKEHSSQFHPRMEGHTGRLKRFYDDLLEIPNLRFISVKEQPFSFIDKAIFVATATGTIGWEAIVRGKPVIIFGNAWYEYCDNVYRVNSKTEIKKVFNKINLPNSTADYMSYVKAIYNNSIYAYHYKGYDKISLIDKKTAVANLSNLIVSLA